MTPSDTDMSTKKTNSLSLCMPLLFLYLTLFLFVKTSFQRRGTNFFFLARPPDRPSQSPVPTARGPKQRHPLGARHRMGPAAPDRARPRQIVLLHGPEQLHGLSGIRRRHHQPAHAIHAPPRKEGSQHVSSPFLSLSVDPTSASDLGTGEAKMAFITNGR